MQIKHKFSTAGHFRAYKVNNNNYNFNSMDKSGNYHIPLDELFGKLAALKNGKYIKHTGQRMLHCGR